MLADQQSASRVIFHRAGEPINQQGTVAVEAMDSIPTVPRKDTAVAKQGAIMVIHATYTTISVRVSSVHAKMQRPAKDDERREDWDALARFIWRTSIIVSILVISLLLRQWEVPEAAGLAIEKVPELVKEGFEYAHRL